MEACYRNYYELAEFLLSRGADVNHADNVCNIFDVLLA
jgi:hypothetical protein